MFYRCSHCGAFYKRKAYYEKHLENCEIKLRKESFDVVEIQAALLLYNSWRKLEMNYQPIQYHDFIENRYFKMFVEFAVWTIDKQADSNSYLEWLIRKKIRARDWTKESTYRNFIDDDLKTESVENAVQKYIIHSKKWADQTGKDWRDYWSDATDERIVGDIANKQISPWIVLGYDRAIYRTRVISREYLGLIREAIDYDYWTRKLEVNNPKLVEWLNEELDEKEEEPVSI